LQLEEKINQPAAAAVRRDQEKVLNQMHGPENLRLHPIESANFPTLIKCRRQEIASSRNQSVILG
jgi:hypothetical protein